MTHPIAPETLPDPRRALEALDRALECARRGATDRPLTLVHRDDFLVAGQGMRVDLRARLDSILTADDPESGLDALLTCGALDALLPEVKALVGFGDGEWRHKDIWKHTKQVVRQADNRVEIRWAALLHDIGKVRTRSVSPDGEVHFFGHAEVGARMFDKLERRTQLFAHEPALASSLKFLILHHLRAAAYDPSWTDSAVRRFGKEMGPELESLLCLSRADITTKRPEKKRKGLRQLDELYDRLRRIQDQDAVVPPLPSGIGDVVMKRFGLPPSRLIGDIKRALEAEIDQGSLASHQPADFYVDHILQNAARYGLKL